MTATQRDGGGREPTPSWAGGKPLPEPQWSISALATACVCLVLIGVIVVVYLLSSPQPSYICTRASSMVATTVCERAP